jgi:hypothetical protein
MSLSVVSTVTMATLQNINAREGIKTISRAISCGPFASSLQNINAREGIKTIRRGGEGRRRELL